jgi:hypothetical protein
VSWRFLGEASISIYSTILSCLVDIIRILVESGRLVKCSGVSFNTKHGRLLILDFARLRMHQQSAAVREPIADDLASPHPMQLSPEIEHDRL